MGCNSSNTNVSGTSSSTAKSSLESQEVDSIGRPGAGQKNCSLAEPVSSAQVPSRLSEEDWSKILPSALIRNCSLVTLKYQQISHNGLDFISSSFLLLESVITLIE